MLKSQLGIIIIVFSRFHFAVDTLSTGGFSVERQASIGTRGTKHLITDGFREPPYSPERLICLAVSCHTGGSLNRPYLGFTVESAAEQVLACVIPVEGCNPRGVACQVTYMLAVLRVVDGDNARISSSS